jgi:hypothetical protein
MKSTSRFGEYDGTNPALVARTTLLAEESSALRRTLQVIAATLDRLLPARALDREVELPLEWFKYPPF